jgi:hypothetical protein
MASNGDFVVTWASAGQDGDGDGVYARGYDRSGAAAGAEFRINSTTAGDQRAPAVAMASNGGFTVAWSGNGPDDGDGVFAQLFIALPGITIFPTTDLVTNEAGRTATFGVVLDSPPNFDVIISLSSSDTTEAVVGPSVLTFNTANWNIAQMVVVTGVDDLIDDGDVAYRIVIAPAVSNDLNYNGMVSTDLEFTNTDDDAAPTPPPPAGGATPTPPLPGDGGATPGTPPPGDGGATPDAPPPGGGATPEAPPPGGGAMPDAPPPGGGPTLTPTPPSPGDGGTTPDAPPPGGGATPDAPPPGGGGALLLPVDGSDAWSGSFVPDPRSTTATNSDPSGGTPGQAVMGMDLHQAVGTTDEASGGRSARENSRPQEESDPGSTESGSETTVVDVTTPGPAGGPGQAEVAQGQFAEMVDAALDSLGVAWGHAGHWAAEALGALVNPLDSEVLALRTGADLVESQELIQEITTDVLWSNLEALVDQSASAALAQEEAVFVAMVTTVAASVGYVIWNFQSFYWVVSALTARPLWKSFDPLDVLDLLEQESDGGKLASFA